jgi:hypothetical protein
MYLSVIRNPINYLSIIKYYDNQNFEFLSSSLIFEE